MTTEMRMTSTNAMRTTPTKKKRRMKEPRGKGRQSCGELTRKRKRRRRRRRRRRPLPLLSPPHYHVFPTEFESERIGASCP
jgi:hypothetical protein